MFATNANGFVVGGAVKRTRKWSFVAQEAGRLAALGLSQVEIARQLGLNKSTVSRWMKAGKLPASRVAEVAHPQVAVRPGQTPAEWAAAVRAAYDLDATDEQLVTVAESALGLSLDSAVSPQVRMTAAGRFQALVKQLALVARNQPQQVRTQPELPEAKPKPPLRVIHRPDPRKLLMAVK